MKGSLPIDLMVARSYYKDVYGSLVLTDFSVWVRAANGWEAAPKPVAARALPPSPAGNATLFVRPALITIDIAKLLKEVSDGDSA